jgi:type IV secretion system protein VirD4
MTAAKRLRAVLPFAILVVLLGLAVATQMAAAGFNYPREFGAGLIDLGRTRIYAPWAVVSWYAQYAKTYPRAFDEASLWGLAAAMLPMGVAIGLARRFRRQVDRPKGPDLRPRARPFRGPLSHLSGD